MTIESVETLDKIMEVMRFSIEANKTLGPFGPDVDRICYHLHEDLDDDESHQDQDEVFRALKGAGVPIERSALDDYPYEIWERRWPTIEWLERDVPRIFEVLNSFNHGLYSISYEPKGSAWHLYAAAFQHAWHHADPASRPPGCEEEYRSQKAALPVFISDLGKAVYAAVREGKLSVSDAVERMDAIWPETAHRWPNKAAEAASMLWFENPLMSPALVHFGPEHQELLQWALWHIVTNPLGKAN